MLHMDGQKIRALSICGSLRRDSWNKRLLDIAEAEGRKFGVETEFISSGPENFPLYNADLHAVGYPARIAELREKAKAADLLLIASPEYNYSVTGVLKNALDWLSVVPGNSLDGKWAVIFGVSNGQFKTVRGQLHLRQVLVAANVLVLPQPQVLVTIPDFDAEKNLPSETLDRLRILIEKTVSHIKK